MTVEYRATLSDGGLQLSLAAWAVLKLEEESYLRFELASESMTKSHALLHALCYLAQVTPEEWYRRIVQLRARRAMLRDEEGYVKSQDSDYHTGLHTAWNSPSPEGQGYEGHRHGMTFGPQEAENSSQSLGTPPLHVRESALSGSQAFPAAASPRRVAERLPAGFHGDDVRNRTPTRPWVQQFEPPGDPTPQLSPNTREQLDLSVASVLREVTKEVKEMKQIADKNSEEGHERVNALSGFAFKPEVPIFKDSDTDFERHWRAYQSLLDCHQFGRTGTRPIDVLNIFRRTLASGSTRMLIYDTIYQRASRRNRLPAEAKEVMEEVKERMSNAIKETLFQKQDRMEKEFHALEMVSKTHAEFRAQYELKIDDMEEAD